MAGEELIYDEDDAGILEWLRDKAARRDLTEPEKEEFFRLMEEGW